MNSSVKQIDTLKQHWSEFKEKQCVKRLKRKETLFMIDLSKHMVKHQEKKA